MQGKELWLQEISMWALEIKKELAFWKKIKANLSMQRL